jgi:hypothetical protein
MSCNSKKSQTQNEIASNANIASRPIATKSVISGPLTNSEPYTIAFHTDQLPNDVYEFVVKMKLHNGSYYVSPNAKRDFKGKFTIFLDDSNKLKPITELVETPLSVEEYDPHPFVNGIVNWVRVNTIYTQQLQVTSKENFQLKGMIQFTIEPRCTLEKIPIIFKYYNGKMRVELFQC